MKSTVDKTGSEVTPSTREMFTLLLALAMILSQIVFIGMAGFHRCHRQGDGLDGLGRFFLPWLACWAAWGATLYFGPPRVATSLAGAAIAGVMGMALWGLRAGAF